MAAEAVLPNYALQRTVVVSSLSAVARPRPAVTRRQEAMKELKDGDHCLVTAGTHKGKSGVVRDINVSKTGHTTITVVQKNGVRFKTLAKNAAHTKPAA
jgi:ribosomal protein S4E